MMMVIHFAEGESLKARLVLLFLVVRVQLLAAVCQGRRRAVEMQVGAVAAVVVPTEAVLAPATAAVPSFAVVAVSAGEMGALEQMK